MRENETLAPGVGSVGEEEFGEVPHGARRVGSRVQDLALNSAPLFSRSVTTGRTLSSTGPSRD